MPIPQRQKSAFEQGRAKTPVSVRTNCYQQTSLWTAWAQGLKRNLIILYNTWFSLMKHTDILQGCAIRKATVQTGERQGRHRYHVSTPKLTIHVFTQEVICSLLHWHIPLLSSKAPQLSITHTGARSLKRGRAVLSGESYMPREQGRGRSPTLATCALAFICDEIPIVGTYYRE